MKIVHLKRGLLWSKGLVQTLIIFWIKNPQETAAVFNFVSKKTLEFPRFLERNIKIEKQSSSFLDSLEQTSLLYKKYHKDFNPSDSKSYKKLEKILNSKSQILYFLVRKLKPKIIVETGVAAGESTGYILQAIKDNSKGKLYSLDLPFQWYIYGDHELHLDSLPSGKLPGYLVPENLKKNWKLVLGNTYSELPKLLDKLESCDIFIHDSEHSYKAMLFEYNESWPHITKNGFLLSDDVHFTKAFDEFSKAKKIKPFYFQGLGILKKV